MKGKQLEKLISLYNEAVENNFTAGEFIKVLQDAKFKIPPSFVESGKEDMNLGEYLEKLNQLRKFTNEQS